MTRSHSTDHTRRPTRRIVLAGLGASLLPLPAAAFTQATSERFVQGLINDVLAMINSGRPEAQLLAEFVTFFARVADLPRIAQSVLGPPFRTASAAQQRGFVTAFQHYMSHKYGRRFREFQGSSITIQRTRPAGNNQFLVESQVRMPGQAPFELGWHVFDSGGGRPLMFDLIIEGIRLISSEREEIRAMLEAERGNLDRLIARLNAY